VERQLDLEGMVMVLLDRYLEQQGAAAGTVKYIIIASDFSDALKHFGHRIQQRLAIPLSTVFRVADNYCANIDIAIGVAVSLLGAKREPSRALIISGAKLGEGLVGRVVGTYGVLGDSAGITVLSNVEGPHLAEVGEQIVLTRGELAEVDLKKDNTVLHLQSYSICLKELLSQSGVLPNEVQKVITHNANQMLIMMVIKSCGIKIGTIDNVNQGKYGHLGSCDLVLNLKTLLERNGRAAGNVVSLNLGVVGTYVSTLFKQ
jgi:3-oxoacyl-[acyl-carrier-protein] synthase III